MTTKRYIIIENGQPMDGEFLTLEGLFESLPYADAGDRVIEIDLDAAMNGRSDTFECTEEMVRRAYAEGHFVGHEERCRDRLAGEFIDFPISKAQARADQADYLRDLRREEAW